MLGETLIDPLFEVVCTGEPLSLAVTVKFETWLVVGVPEIVPPGESESPAGRLPDVIAHV